MPLWHWAGSGLRIALGTELFIEFLCGLTQYLVAFLGIPAWVIFPNANTIKGLSLLLLRTVEGFPLMSNKAGSGP